MQIIKKNKPNILPKIAFSILNSQSSKESIFNFMESAPAGATIPSKSCSISTIFINKLLNTYDLNSKIIKREKNYTVYIKEAEKISDFLRVIKAFSAVMYFEDIRIYRDHKNMTNRLNNCEQANMDKVFMTANKQINDIEKLYELDMVDLLDEKLKTVIEYRMKYKESSLKELAEIMSFETGTEITKSGLNHRFRKIREILDNIENK